MNRKEMIQFVNENVLPQIDWRYTDKDTPWKTIRLIERYRIGKPMNIKMVARVDDGFLFINDEPLGRIAMKAPKLNLSNESLYWEGRILARQESMGYYD
jgi:hypothetical protein